ncbi:MAG: hypothetical protein ACMUJM_01525 [bacterium]
MQKENIKIFKNNIIFYLFTLTYFLAITLFIGCAPSMLMKVEDLREIQPNEGIVVGSILVRVIDAQNEPKGFLNSLVSKPFMLKNKKWDITTEAKKQYSTEKVNTEEEKEEAVNYKTYSISGKEGEEKVFVCRLPAGEYAEFVNIGIGESSGKLGIRFRVNPGTTTYIGQLIIDLPPKTKLIGKTKFKVSIVDRQETAMESLAEEYGSIVINAVKGLMYKKMSDLHLNTKMKMNINI